MGEIVEKITKTQEIEDGNILQEESPNKSSMVSCDTLVAFSLGPYLFKSMFPLFV